MNRGRGRGFVPEPHLDENQLRQQAIDGFLNREYYNPIWVDREFLERSGIMERVTTMLTTSGWPGLLDLSGPCDKEDTAEFLATLNFTGARDHQEISYRFRGEPATCTIAEMRRIFGWGEGNIFVPRLGRWFEAWRIIAPSGYNGGNSSPRHFTDPALFYMHQILSKTLFARKNADKVGQLEMSVLIMLKEGNRINWAHYFCKHLVNLRANSPISCGGMVTYFLRQCHQPPAVPGHTILEGEKAGWRWFRHGRHVQRTPDGNIEWIYFRDASLRPPSPERRPVGRPPGRGRGRQDRGHGHALAGPQREPRHQHESGPSRQPAQVQEQIARQFLDTVFNSTRASILAGQEFDIAPAPPGWNMGDPIPPEYLQPRRPPRRR